MLKLLAVVEREALDSLLDRRFMLAALFGTLVVLVLGGVAKLYSTRSVVEAVESMSPERISEVVVKTGLAKLVPVSVVQGGSKWAMELQRRLREQESVELVACRSLSEAMRQLEAGRTVAVLDLTGLSESGGMVLLVANNSNYRSVIAVSAISSTVRELSREAALEEVRRAGLSPSILSPISLEFKSVGGELPSYAGGYAAMLKDTAIAFTLMLPYITTAAFVAESIAGERDRKTLELLLSLPVSWRTIVAGKALTYTMASAGLFLAWMALLGAMGVEMRGKATLAALEALFGLAVSSIGVAISAFSKDSREANVLYSFLVGGVVVANIAPVSLRANPVAALAGRALGVLSKLFHVPLLVNIASGVAYSPRDLLPYAAFTASLAGASALVACELLAATGAAAEPLISGSPRVAAKAAAGGALAVALAAAAEVPVVLLLRSTAALGLAALMALYAPVVEELAKAKAALLASPKDPAEAGLAGFMCGLVFGLGESAAAALVAVLAGAWAYAIAASAAAKALLHSLFSAISTRRALSMSTVRAVAPVAAAHSLVNLAVLAALAAFM